MKILKSSGPKIKRQPASTFSHSSKALSSHLVAKKDAFKKFGKIK